MRLVLKQESEVLLILLVIFRGRAMGGLAIVASIHALKAAAAEQQRSSSGAKREERRRTSSLVSFSLSRELSTAVDVRRMSCLSDTICCWSSADSFTADAVFCTVLAMSEVSSLHFLTRRFSDSCDFFSAR